MMKRIGFAVLLLSFVSATVPFSAVAETVVYSNGPGNDNFDAWTINQGAMVTDSFTLSNAATANGVTFNIWAFSGDTLSSVDWSIGTSQYDGTPATAITTGVFQGTNSFGFDIYSESFTFPDISLSAGTYWFTLQNAVASNGDTIFWDENDGPSLGYSNTVGFIGDYDDGIGFPGLSGSETFSITATSNTVIPEPGSFLLLLSGLMGVAGMTRRKAIVR